MTKVCHDEGSDAGTELEAGGHCKLTSHQSWVIADEREVRNQILPSPITRAVEAGLRELQARLRLRAARGAGYDRERPQGALRLPGSGARVGI